MPRANAQLAPRRSHKVLMTGFGSFGKTTHNPSFHGLKRAKEAGLLPKTTAIGEIPTTWRGAAQEFRGLVDRHRPHTVVSFGVGNWIAPILRWETLGRNVRNTQLPDAEGYKSERDVVEPQGQDQLQTTLFIGGLQDVVHRLGGSLVTSENAGDYLCNDLIYEALTYLNQMGIPFAFIHVPIVRESDEGLIQMIVEHYRKREPQDPKTWDQLVKEHDVLSLEQLSVLQAAIATKLTERPIVAFEVRTPVSFVDTVTSHFLKSLPTPESNLFLAELTRGWEEVKDTKFEIGLRDLELRRAVAAVIDSYRQEYLATQSLTPDHRKALMLFCDWIAAKRLNFEFPMASQLKWAVLGNKPLEEEGKGV